MFNKLYLWIINFLLYPYVLGFWSENNGGALVITNRNCNQMRGIGSRKWQSWDNSPNYPRIYNEYLEVATPDHLSFLVFLDFFKKESIKNPFRATVISLVCRPYILAIRGDLQGQYHYCIVKDDPFCGVKQNIQFIFPGSTEDLWSTLPKSEVGLPSPVSAGSLGALAQLPLNETISGVLAAKKRLLKSI